MCLVRVPTEVKRRVRGHWGVGVKAGDRTQVVFMRKTGPERLNDVWNGRGG